MLLRAQSLTLASRACARRAPPRPPALRLGAVAAEAAANGPSQVANLWLQAAALLPAPAQVVSIHAIPGARLASHSLPTASMLPPSCHPPMCTPACALQCTIEPAGTEFASADMVLPSGRKVWYYFDTAADTARCCAACRNTPGCAAFTLQSWGSKRAGCFLKTSTINKTVHSDQPGSFTSGRPLTSPVKSPAALSPAPATKLLAPTLLQPLPFFTTSLVSAPAQRQLA